MTSRLPGTATTAPGPPELTASTRMVEGSEPAPEVVRVIGVSVVTGAFAARAA